MELGETSKKRLCKAVRLSIIAEQLGIIVPSSSKKKTSVQKTLPKRIAELNFSNDSSPTRLTKKTNARKQLWSADTNPRSRRTSMKAKNVRKTVYGRQPTILKGKTKSVDETLPLVDLEEFEHNAILYKNLRVSQPKFKVNFATPRNTVSKTNFAKPGTSQNIAKPATSQNIPKPVANFSFAKPAAKSSNGSSNYSKCLKGLPGSISKIPQSGRKIESSKTDPILEEILKHVKKFSEQMQKFDNRLDNIEVLVNKCSCNTKATEISNTTDAMTKNGTMESVKKCLFNAQHSEKAIIENSINNDVKDTFLKNDLVITNKVSLQDTGTEEEQFFSKVSTPKNSVINNLENKQIENDILQIQKEKEPEQNNLDKSNSTATVRVKDCPEFQEHLKLVNQVYNITDASNKTTKKSEAKKTSVGTSKFELLEQQIKNGLLDDSTSISSFPNSPFDEMEIEKLINNNILDDVFEATTNGVVTKSDQTQSAPTSSPQVCTPTDNLSEMEKTYKQMKDNLQFLCTPMVKKTVTVVTSTKLPNSQRKILSRRVQEQIFLLNED